MQSVSHSKTFSNFTEFLDHYKQEHLVNNAPGANQTTVATTDGNQDDLKLINCLVCGAELKCTYVDMLKHFQSEHELNLFDLKLNQTDLELIHTLHIHNQVQLSQSVKLKSRCFIKIPPSLVNANVAELKALTKVDLINKELKLLNEIYKEQIIEKQIVSWLNSEQFLRRNFNYNSYVCIICNATKSQILETHYHLNKSQNQTPSMQVAIVGLSATTTPESSTQASNSSRHQFYSDEMKTVVLTNHVLSHFNEYCYRCMSCKISWPDRTQLLKHAQECSNSQVVRTKTKYKLKANCRLQLKFYLQTYLDYWQYEKCLENKTSDQIQALNNVSVAATELTKPLNCKIFLNDIILNKNLLLEQSSRSSLNSIRMIEGNKIGLVDDEAEEETVEATGEGVADTNTKVRDDPGVQKPVEIVQSEEKPEKEEAAEESKAEIVQSESAEVANVEMATSEETTNNEKAEEKAEETTKSTELREEKSVPDTPTEVELAKEKEEAIETEAPTKTEEPAVVEESKESIEMPTAEEEKEKESEPSASEEKVSEDNKDVSMKMDVASPQETSLQAETVPETTITTTDTTAATVEEKEEEKTEEPSSTSN